MDIYSEEEKRKRIYRTWGDMIKRCFNPNCKSYKNYGGRGITVCDRWSDPFLVKIGRRSTSQGCLNFYEDMEKEWTPERNTIDRINNDGNYEKENCQWLSRSENTKKEVKELIENGTHNFLGSETNNKRVRDGIHPFLGGEIQRKSNQERVKNGTHPFLGGEINQKRIDNGTHNFLGGINKGKFWINNGIINKIIHPKDIQKFFDEGWIKGRISKLKGKYKKKIFIQ